MKSTVPPTSAPPTAASPGSLSASSGAATAHPADRATVVPLIQAEAIQRRVHEIAVDLRRDLGSGELTLLCILKGSVMFTADLARALDGPVQLEFLGVASYGGGTESSGVVRITHDLATPIEGRDIIVVEDIVDTGLTLQYLKSLLQARNPRSLKVCALLHKPGSNSPVLPDYCGFSIGSDFVVGYGLDWGGRFRNLPYVGKVVPSADGQL